MPCVHAIAEGVGSSEYADQVQFYSELAEELAISSLSGLSGGPVFWSDGQRLGLIGFVKQALDVNPPEGEDTIHAGPRVNFICQRASYDDFGRWVEYANREMPKRREVLNQWARSRGTGDKPQMTDRRQTIQERAYEFWEAEGRQHGNDLAHWFRAETETPRLVEYLPHIGRLTIEAARLEEIVLVYVIAFSDEPSEETRFKYMHKGLDATLNRLSELINAYVSTYYRQEVLDLIEAARQAKNKRNEIVHGVWGEMVEVDTREFRGVSRSRYDKDKTNKTVPWDVTTPTIEELKRIGQELADVATKLYALLYKVWGIDDGVMKFRLDQDVNLPVLQIVIRSTSSSVISSPVRS